MNVSSWVFVQNKDWADLKKAVKLREERSERNQVVSWVKGLEVRRVRRVWIERS